MPTFSDMTGVGEIAPLESEGEKRDTFSLYTNFFSLYSPKVRCPSDAWSASPTNAMIVCALSFCAYVSVAALCTLARSFSFEISESLRTSSSSVCFPSYVFDFSEIETNYCDGAR